jgi:hypothetical protein
LLNIGDPLGKLCDTHGHKMSISKWFVVHMMDEVGSDYTLWQIRLPDENGELSEAFKSDFHEYGENAKKMRVLKGLAKLKSTFKETDKMSFFKSLEEAINITEAGLVREGKCFDRLPLTSWIDPNSAPVVLIGDGFCSTLFLYHVMSKKFVSILVAFHDSIMLICLFTKLCV